MSVGVVTIADAAWQAGLERFNGKKAGTWIEARGYAFYVADVLCERYKKPYGRVAARLMVHFGWAYPLGGCSCNRCSAEYRR